MKERIYQAIAKELQRCDCFGVTKINLGYKLFSYFHQEFLNLALFGGR